MNKYFGRTLAKKARNSIKQEQFKFKQKICLQRLVLLLKEIGDTQIALYYPLKGQFNILGLKNLLPNHQFSLPSVQQTKILLFKRIIEQQFVKGRFNIAQSNGVQVIPRVIICPLLGFNLQGHRLGYGGGYYDSTIQSIRAKGLHLRVIGIGLADCQIDFFPTSTDQIIDQIHIF